MFKTREIVAGFVAPQPWNIRAPKPQAKPEPEQRIVLPVDDKAPKQPTAEAAAAALGLTIERFEFAGPVTHDGYRWRRGLDVGEAKHKDREAAALWALKYDADLWRVMIGWHESIDSVDGNFYERDDKRAGVWLEGPEDWCAAPGGEKYPNHYDTDDGFGKEGFANKGAAMFYANARLAEEDAAIAAKGM